MPPIRGDSLISDTAKWGAVAEWVRASTGDRTIDGSTPTAGDFEFGTLAIPLTLLCQCLSDETLKAVALGRSETTRWRHCIPVLFLTLSFW